MNAATIVRAAMTSIPASLKCQVTLRDKDGQETTGTAVGLPASGGDAYEDRSLTRKKGYTFSLLADGLAFAPSPGMAIIRGTDEWRILAAPAIDPTGTHVLLYRIMAER